MADDPRKDADKTPPMPERMIEDFDGIKVDRSEGEGEPFDFSLDDEGDEGDGQ